MKSSALSLSLSICAAAMLVAPDAAQAFRGGFHGGGFHGGGRGFHGGGRWARGGGRWHGGGRWAGGGGHWHSGGHWYGGGWGVGAAAAGAVGAAAAYGSSCYQQQNVWNGYQYVVQTVRVC